MNKTGNTNYADIQNKKYININADPEKQTRILSELNNRRIPFSARYTDDRITITVSQTDLKRANEAVKSVDRKPFTQYRKQSDKQSERPAFQPIQSEPPQQKAESVPTDRANIQNEPPIKEQQENKPLSPTELRKMMLQLSSDPAFMKEFMAAQEMQARKAEESERQAAEQAEKAKQAAQQAEQQKPQNVKESKPPEKQPFFDVSQIDTSKETYQLLPIISTKVENQKQKIESLSVKRSVAEDKISVHKERINALNEKAKRITTTNQMLYGLTISKTAPAFVKSAADKAIKINKAKIGKIVDEKIPKRKAKIEKQENKITKFDHKIKIAQYKADRLTSLSNVVTSFSLVNNSERRKQFAAAMDNLHNSSVNLYQARIDSSTAKINALTADYKKSKNPVFKAAAQQSIIKQKSVRTKCTKKRNKLLGIIIPVSEQSEQVQDKVLKQAETVVANAVGKENISVAEVADNVAVSPFPALPPIAISEPDTTQEEVDRLMPEIAEVMSVSVPELKNLPMDVKEMLVLDYNNSSSLTPEEIQEQLSALVSLDSRVEENIEEHKEERAGLVMMESSGETALFRLNENVSEKEVLDILSDNGNSPKNTYQAMKEIGTHIDIQSYAEYEQSEKCTFTAEVDFNKKEVSVTEINGGNGGISESNREDKDIFTVKYDLSELGKEKDNPLKNTEAAIEGSYSNIDGVINNVPPEKPVEKEPPATISMSTLLSGAAIAEAAAQDSGRNEKVHKPQEIE